MGLSPPQVHHSGFIFIHLLHSGLSVDEKQKTRKTGPPVLGNDWLAPPMGNPPVWALCRHRPYLERAAALLRSANFTDWARRNNGTSRERTDKIQPFFEAVLVLIV